MIDDEGLNFDEFCEKLKCELEGKPYRPKPKTVEEEVIYHFEDVINNATNKTSSLVLLSMQDKS